MNTIESWINFTRYYGGIVGARDCFELACEEMLRLENSNSEVHRITASRGDGGIDIYVSNGENVHIYQCKYFMDNLNASRWEQIKNSFLRILSLEHIHVRAWYLCVPKEFTKEDIKKIGNFKQKFETKDIAIKFVDGNEIISRMKSVDIVEKWFTPIANRHIVTNSPKACPEYVERMEKNEIKEIIQRENSHVLISGMGGIGKTTLCENVFNDIKNSFDTASWIVYQDDLLTSFGALMLEQKNEEELFQNLKSFLCSKKDQRNIIFVDNVNEKYLCDKNRSFFENNAIIVATSRLDSIAGYYNYEVYPLEDLKCIEVFSSYYHKEIDERERQLILNLAKQFDRNTLVLELLARIAQKSSLNLKAFLEKTEEDGMLKTKIKVQNYREKTYANISEHIAALYSMSGLDEEKKRILVNLSLSRDPGVTKKFMDMINASDEDIGDLIEFGWIKKTIYGINMHALIREAIGEQMKVKFPYVQEIVKIYTDREFYEDEISIFEKNMHFSVIIHLLPVMDYGKREHIYIFYNLIKLMDALKITESLDDIVGLAIQEIEKKEDSIEMAKIAADIFNAAGLSYLEFDNRKAIIAFKCEEQLIDRYFPKKKRAKSICKGNLALAFLKIDYEKARDMMREVLVLQKECFGEESQEVADIYHNLGKSYYDVGEFGNAIPYFERSFELKQKNGNSTYNMLKTEFALANSLNFNMKEPYEKDTIKRIRGLYVSILEKCALYNNISIQEQNYILSIIAGFLEKIGDESSATKLKELTLKYNIEE